MPHFRKRPVVIEAVQWTGNNLHEMEKLGLTSVHLGAKANTLYIPTMEGVMEASLSDWIIKGVKGEFYPCKPDIFAMTYEEVGTFKAVIPHLVLDGCCDGV